MKKKKVVVVNDLEDKKQTDSIVGGDFNEDEEDTQRAQWTNQTEFLLACIGYAVGLANFWRFPYLCMRNGGGAFLFPYVTLLVLVGLPIYCMEMILGQFSSSGLINVWNITPISSGLGISSTVVTTLLTIYYNTIMVWALFYMVMSFRKDVPWRDCGNWWNSENCSNAFTQGNTTDTLQMNASRTMSLSTPVEEFWSNRALSLSDGIDEVGSIRWEMAVCLLVLCLLLFLCLFRGIKSSGKASYVTALVPYVILTVFLIRGAMLPGSLIGIKLYIIPDWKKVLSFEVWCEACLQIFYSIGCGLGGVLTFSSYNKFKLNCIRASVITCVACGATSFFAGFVVFTVIGHMMHVTQLPMDQVVKQGPALAFSVYPEVIKRLPPSPLWAVLFFGVLIVLGLGCQIGNLEAPVTAIADRFPTLHKKYRTLFVGLFVLVCFVFGLLFTTNGGMFLFQLFDWYVTPLPLVIISLCECFIVSFVYGAGRFYRDAKFMLGGVSYFWFACWCVVCPFVLVVILVVSAVRFQPPVYGTYIFPPWSIAIGWTLAMVSLVPIPVCGVLAYIRSSGSVRKRLVSIFSPSPDWGPLLAKHRALYSVYNKGSTWTQRMSLRLDARGPQAEVTGNGTYTNGKELELMLNNNC